VYRPGSTVTCNKFIFFEMVDLCVWAHLQMYWSKSFKMKRLGAPTVGSGGVWKPARMVALDVSAYVCVAIVVGIPCP